MTVTELLRLAPFSLGIITLLLAAGGLLYAHAYGRYGDDAAVGFVARVRFALALIATLAVPALMLISFGHDEVPHWLTPGRAALLIGFGLLATVITTIYLFRSVGRPNAFLSSVGRRVRVGRLNRYAEGRRWRNPDDFAVDLRARKYALAEQAPKFGTARKLSVTARMHTGRLLLRLWRTDHTEMLFDAAAAGVRNSNARTWRAALDVLGRRLRSRKLSQAAAQVVVANSLVLEEAAHRYQSEDCKIRLASALGEVGRAPLDEEAAEHLGDGIATLAERRLFENRPVNAVVGALEVLARENPRAALLAARRLGQHLVRDLKPPAMAHGSEGYEPEHPTRKLLGVLSDLADRAQENDDADLNLAVIDACALICEELPGVQDERTLEEFGGVLSRTGKEAARRYGNGGDWFGTVDAARDLRTLYSVLDARHRGPDPQDPRTHSWVVESIAALGSWALGNRTAKNFGRWRGRSDVAILVAQQLDVVLVDKLAHSLHELLFRQQHEAIPRERRQEFVGICQRMRGHLLGLAKPLEVLGLNDDSLDPTIS